MKFKKGHKINLGNKHSKETKEKMSEIAKKRSRNPRYIKLFLSRINNSKKLKEYHESRKSTRVEIKCKVCGKLFKVKKSRAMRKGCLVPKFCSKKCFFKGRIIPFKGKERPEISGKKNHNWNNGSSFISYPPEFSRALKTRILKRDNCVCQYCGTTQKQELKRIKRKLTIHHIDYNKFNNKENNLITLCMKCNIMVNRDRVDWMNYFQELIKKIC